MARGRRGSGRSRQRSRAEGGTNRTFGRREEIRPGRAPAGISGGQISPPRLSVEAPFAGERRPTACLAGCGSCPAPPRPAPSAGWSTSDARPRPWPPAPVTVQAPTETAGRSAPGRSRRAARSPTLGAVHSPPPCIRSCSTWGPSRSPPTRPSGRSGSCSRRRFCGPGSSLASGPNASAIRNGYTWSKSSCRAWLEWALGRCR